MSLVAIPGLIDGIDTRGIDAGEAWGLAWTPLTWLWVGVLLDLTLGFFECWLAMSSGSEWESL
jgi:hypothetical protein